MTRKPKQADVDFKDLSDLMDERDAVINKAKAYARRAGEHLRKMLPEKSDDPDGFDTIGASDALATLIDGFVHRNWSSGENLCLEWMMEHFWGLQVERVVPTIEEIWSICVEQKHTQRNPFVWNDLDYEVFHVPTKDKGLKVLVLDSQGCSYLLVNDQNSIMQRIHWRKLWNKLGRNCIKSVDRPTLRWYRQNGFRPTAIHGWYGDARDNGYLFSYERMNIRGGQMPNVDRGCDQFGHIDHALWWFKVTLKALKGGDE